MTLTYTTEAYTTWTGGDYVEDHSANVVMVGVRAAPYNNFRNQYRACRNPLNNQWEAEYFCDPDHILIVEDDAASQAHYLDYRTWMDDLYVGAATAKASAIYAPSMGSIASLLPVTTPLPPLDAELRFTDMMEEGKGKIESTICVWNRGTTPKRFTYVYQDAAFMWYPDNAQLHVESMHLTATTVFTRTINRESAGQIAQGQWQFAGTFHRTKGVVAGILSFAPTDRIGIAKGYLGFSMQPSGYAVTTPGYRQSNIPSGLGSPLTIGVDIFNRFAALDFGVLQPGQGAGQTLYRIMAVLPASDASPLTDDQVQAWVSQKVVQHYGG